MLGEERTIATGMVASDRLVNWNDVGETKMLIRAVL